MKRCSAVGSLGGLLQQDHVGALTRRQPVDEVVEGALRAQALELQLRQRLGWRSGLGRRRPFGGGILRERVVGAETANDGGLGLADAMIAGELGPELAGALEIFAFGGASAQTCIMSSALRPSVGELLERIAEDQDDLVVTVGSRQAPDVSHRASALPPA
jgi:hypothetical protein